jgi:hypothetical protein
MKRKTDTSKAVSEKEGKERNGEENLIQRSAEQILSCARCRHEQAGVIGGEEILYGLGSYDDMVNLNNFKWHYLVLQ